MPMSQSQATRTATSSQSVCTLQSSSTCSLLSYTGVAKEPKSAISVAISPIQNSQPSPSSKQTLTTQHGLGI
ncbi:hypothetical protein BcDW1_6802 [Botrytis cinerea BcDW1]|uniref:Uncharacterized protein n=1 Tax=Botryotinia fuckeliana (strain BcDW1) TaxID=1290391 RepID=M7UD21_BOTF1|nr:hypothetical protein BcDW1_6802 [Botrytis cinerea BcDW1]